MQNENGKGTNSIVVAAIMSIASLVGEFITGLFNNSQQKAHDKEMAEIELQNQQKLMDYQNNLQQDTNMIANQKGHAVAAGYSPALLYGSTLPSASVSGGSAAAGANTLKGLNLFNRVPVDSVSSTILQQGSQDIARQRMQAETRELESRALYNDMKTAQTYYDARISKRLQNTIVDQATVNLENARRDSALKAFELKKANLMLPYELQNANIVNQKTAQDIKESASRIIHNNWENRALAANIRQMNEISETEPVHREQVRESIRNAALGRVMSEFGLNGRLEPSAWRSMNALTQSLYYEQMKGATAALVAVGYPAEEAAKAVLYYNARDPKDVSPSVINGLARVITAGMK